MHNEEPAVLRHTRESGYLGYFGAEQTWIPACAGMTNRGGKQVLAMPTIFMLCRRAQAHGHSVVNATFLLQARLTIAAAR